MTNDFWKPLRGLTFQDVEILKESSEREKAFLDFKEFDFTPGKKWFDLKGVGDDLAAFANSGGGRLIFGAKEKDEHLVEFKGVPRDKRQGVDAKLRNTAHSVHPPVDIEVVDIEIPGTETYIYVVEIRAGQRGPFLHSEKYRERRGAANVAMSHTSVVQAVLAAQPFKYPGGQKLGLPELGGNPLGPLSQGWFFGVQLSPSFETGQTVYDAFSPESDEMIAWLVEGHGYTKAVKEPERLTAFHNKRWRLELSRSGQIAVVGCIDHEVNSLPLGKVVHKFCRLLQDAGTCLTFAMPTFTVDAHLWLWPMGNQGALGLEWIDEESEEAVIRGISKPLTRIEVPLNRVADFVAQNGKFSPQVEKIGSRVSEYLRLTALAQSDPFLP
jgi:hypothetical protein